MSKDDKSLEPEARPSGATRASESLEQQNSGEFADAMILGDVSIQSDAFDMLEGTHVDEEGQANAYLLYAAGRTARGISPDSILARSEKAQPDQHRLTPYERFLFDMLDGQLDMRSLCSSTGLDKHEVMVTLLTLIDKALIQVLPEEDPLTSTTEVPHTPIRIDRKASVLNEDNSKVSIDSYDTLAGPLPILASSTEVEPLPQMPEAASELQIADVTQEIAIDALGKSVPAIDGERYSADSTDDLEAETFHTPINLPRDALDTDIPWSDEKEVVEHLEDSTCDNLSPPNANNEIPIDPLLDSSSLSLPPNAFSTAPDSDHELVVPLPQSSHQEFDFGDEEEELSLGLGLSEESEKYSDLELNDSLELDLNNLHNSSQRLPSSAFMEQLPHANTGLLNDAVADAVNELADEFSREKSSKKQPAFGSLNDDSLELSDAFQSLENALQAENWPDSKPKKATSRPKRLGSNFITALPTPDMEVDAQAKEASPALKQNKPSHRAIEARGAVTSDRSTRQKFRKPRGVIKEVDRRRAPKNLDEAPAAQLRPSPKKAGANATSSRSSPSGAGLARGDKLFQEALTDKAAGNFVSARMNVKLALTFDPKNTVYLELLENLRQEVPSQILQPTQAMQYYEKATASEKAGNIDDAISDLYKALNYAKDPPIYNRLGVLLAMKKMEFIEARKMIETAISLDPTNPTYQHNLKKVLTMQASLDVDSQKVPAKNKKGILGFLSRRKKR